MSAFLIQAIVFVLLAFCTALFLAAQERWGAIKCLALGAFFPVTVPVILYFTARKWWVDRDRVKAYARQVETTKELNDVYVPKDHVEVNPNFADVNPFETPLADEFSVYDPTAQIEDFINPTPIEEPPVSEEEISASAVSYTCPFHYLYPNVPYSGCTCHK